MPGSWQTRFLDLLHFSCVLSFFKVFTNLTSQSPANSNPCIIFTFLIPISTSQSAKMEIHQSELPPSPLLTRVSKAAWSVSKILYRFKHPGNEQIRKLQKMSSVQCNSFFVCFRSLRRRRGYLRITSWAMCGLITWICLYSIAAWEVKCAFGATNGGLLEAIRICILDLIKTPRCRILGVEKEVKIFNKKIQPWSIWFNFCVYESCELRFS